MNGTTKFIALLIGIAIVVFINGCMQSSMPEEEWTLFQDEDFFVDLCACGNYKLYVDLNILAAESSGTLTNSSGFKLKASYGSEYSNTTNLVLDITAKLEYSETNLLYSIQGVAISSQKGEIILWGTRKEIPYGDDDVIILTKGTNIIDYAGNQIAFFN